MKYTSNLLRALAGLPSKEEIVEAKMGDGEKKKLRSKLFAAMEIEESEHVDKVFFDFDAKQVLWFDDNEDVWCVNSYTVRGDSVSVDAMPHLQFKD